MNEKTARVTYVPFKRTDYQLSDALSPEEREAISTGYRRSAALGQPGALPFLLLPLRDIASRSSISARLVRITLLAVLAETHQAGQPCWLWTQERWLTLCQQHSSGRPLLVAFAFHLGPFPSPLSLPVHGAPSLYASAIYGRNFVSHEINRLTDVLISLGYVGQNQKHNLSGMLGVLMLMNNDPQLETFTTELLWQGQNCHDRGISRVTGKISYALAAMGIIKSPLRMRNYKEWHEKPTEGIAPDWARWCRKWRETSVLRPRSRESQYSFILRCGLWLAREKPEIREPSDWTMETCASFIAMVSRLKVDGLSLNTHKGGRRSNRSGEPLMPHSRSRFVYAVRRFMLDYESWGWGNLKFSPARHLSTPDTPLFRQGVNPRVIDDPVWLKLVWASLNLRQEDLLSEIHYPLSMLQAMAVIWGIGRRISVRLNQLGINTGLQLADSNVSMIRKNFDVIVERTVRELNGESCLALEDAPPPKQQIVNSRSFGQRVTQLEDMQQAVVLYATRAAEKLREQQSHCRHISVSIATGRHGSEPQYSNTASRISDYPTNDTRDIIELALSGLSTIWREGYRYAKAGVSLADFYQSGVAQYDMFSEQQPRANADALMSALDKINRSGRGKVWFAGQGARDSSWQMKREMLSPRYTTRLSDIPLIK